MNIGNKMVGEIKKSILFNYFKANEIVFEHNVIGDECIRIIEENNKNKSNVLKELKICGLNSNNRYFIIKPENPTNIKPNKQTEIVIIEHNKENDFMNLIFVEMKPQKVKLKKEVIPKFEKTFNWVYLLFNLLKDKENKNFKVYLLLCKYSHEKKDDLYCKGELKTLETLTIKYTRIIKHSNGTESMKINLNEILSIKPIDLCEES